MAFLCQGGILSTVRFVGCLFWFFAIERARTWNHIPSNGSRSTAFLFSFWGGFGSSRDCRRFRSHRTEKMQPVLLPGERFLGYFQMRTLQCDEPVFLGIPGFEWLDDPRIGFSEA